MTGKNWTCFIWDFVKSYKTGSQFRAVCYVLYTYHRKLFKHFWKGIGKMTSERLTKQFFNRLKACGKLQRSNNHDERFEAQSWVHSLSYSMHIYKIHLKFYCRWQYFVCMIDFDDQTTLFLHFRNKQMRMV